MSNQYHAPPANSPSMYMPHIPVAATSSPQHQPQVYQQNVNHQSIPPMQQVRSKQIVRNLITSGRWWIHVSKSGYDYFLE